MRAKKKAITTTVPQTEADAAAELARLGEAQRALGSIQAALDETVAAAKAAAEDLAAPHRAVVETATYGLEIWAVANRQTLTKGNGKTIALATGELRWRTNPPSVALRGTTAAKLIDVIRELALPRFLRTKVELDKEALLREPDVASTLPGVSIEQAEAFEAIPAGLALREAP
jgi:phage host-nuclease inhibitor protein Gam